MIGAPLLLADSAAWALRRLDPERAHRLTVLALAAGLGPKRRAAVDLRLMTRVAGLDFENPVGLAAGFDKNAEAPDACLALGFGFVEVGAATPRAQAGNPRPRVFRLTEDQAIINRYGFNNDGAERIAARLAARRMSARGGVVGVNLGANKESADRVADYLSGLRAFDGLVDFYTINISSPNTPGLRDLQGRAALDDLLARVSAERAKLRRSAPVFLKVAPDLSDADKADIAAAALTARVDALIVSNTTLARAEMLKSPSKMETGGLSGAPLFAPSTRLLGEFYQTLRGEIPLIGVGGVASAADAYAKIRAGAALLQLYTGLVYQGPGLVSRILKDLPKILEADGFRSVAEAVGAG